MSTTTLTIKTAVNGFTLEYRDPEIDAKNRDDGPWIDPYKTVVCKDAAEVSAVVTSILPFMLEDEKEDNPHADFQSAFKEALKELS